MGRFGIGETLSGTVKSIQHVTGSIGCSSTNTVDITISAVDQSKSYCIYTGSAASSYGADANDQEAHSYGFDSNPGVNLTSSTNVRLYMNDLDADGPTYSRTDASAKVTVVETT
tara:strand:- start:1070 stop:1411 length:342 start_codon:yes stop_codon:yes gene_type:complete